MARRILPMVLRDSVVLDGSGNGEVSMSPANYGETWKITLIGINVAPVPPATLPVLEPTARIYLDGGFIDGTYTGSLDSSNVDLTLQTSQRIACRWQGGDATAVATLVIQGEKIIEGS